MLRDLSEGASTSFFSFSMSLSTRWEPMKPAPPVTRILMLAWIKQQFSADNQDPEAEHAKRPRAHGEGRGSGLRDRALTWKNLEKRSGDGVGGGRVLMCSPLLPLVAIASRNTWSRPDPTQITPSEEKSRDRDRTITEFRATKKCGRGWETGAALTEQLTQRGLGSACLARTRGTGGLNQIRLGRTTRKPSRSEPYL